MAGRDPQTRAIEETPAAKALSERAAHITSAVMRLLTLAHAVCNRYPMRVAVRIRTHRNTTLRKARRMEDTMSKPTVEQTKLGVEAIAFCIARTLIERDPSLKSPMRANLRKMFELLDASDDHGAADMVEGLAKALNDPAFFKREGVR